MSPLGPQAAAMGMQRAQQQQQQQSLQAAAQQGRGGVQPPAQRQRTGAGPSQPQQVQAQQPQPPPLQAQPPSSGALANPSPGMMAMLFNEQAGANGEEDVLTQENLHILAKWFDQTPDGRGGGATGGGGSSVMGGGSIQGDQGNGSLDFARNGDDEFADTVLGKQAQDFSFDL